MLFNSTVFIAFFILTAFLYYVIPYKHRWILLLLASYIFYMAWNPAFICLILFSTFINYAAALKIHGERDKRKSRTTFLVTLLISFGLLFVFKYLTFINDTFIYLFSKAGIYYNIPKFSIILPMGISFFTFQAVGYTIDVYRGDFKPEENFFRMSLFITFFPQLVAGPIERYTDLAPQLFTDKKFKSDNLITGLKFMAFGLFKKAVIADRIAVLVNTVFSSPKYYDGLALTIASLFFTFQIYCDFSGYSDIALGCAKILGIDLMQNFRQPFLSKNTQDFWRRWHISLSQWFKDYLYIPMGGSRVSTPKHFFNTFITFLVSGLWHGANWTFVVWGALHGIYRIIGDVTFKIRRKIFSSLDKLLITKLFRIVFTFLLVCTAFIFFRANTVTDGFYIVCNLFSGYGNLTDFTYVFQTLNSLGITFLELIISLALILFLYMTDIISGKENIHVKLMGFPFIIRFSFYILITMAIISLGVYYNAGQFIYFQF